MSKNKFSWADPSNPVAFPVARAGYPVILASAFATIVFALSELVFLAFIGLVVSFFICYFFRDPDRVIPSKKGAIVSPADGKVIVVENVEGSPAFEGTCIKISIFMSVFNVHVNRIPHEGVIKKISYYPGKFFSANLDKASTQNEHNKIYIETEEGEKISMVQVAGLIARRIICNVQEGDRVVRGQRFGMICFGSRVDVYLPNETNLNVVVGNKVKSGTSVLGYLK